jgi:hypothetical protein
MSRTGGGLYAATGDQWDGIKRIQDTYGGGLSHSKAKGERNGIQTKGNTHKEITHGGSSGGGGASLTISTRRPGTPILAIWYESSPVS